MFDSRCSVVFNVRCLMLGDDQCSITPLVPKERGMHPGMRHSMHQDMHEGMHQGMRQDMRQGMHQLRCIPWYLLRNSAFRNIQYTDRSRMSLIPLRYFQTSASSVRKTCAVHRSTLTFEVMSVLCVFGTSKLPPLRYIEVC